MSNAEDELKRRKGQATKRQSRIGKNVQAIINTATTGENGEQTAEPAAEEPPSVPVDGLGFPVEDKSYHKVFEARETFKLAVSAITKIGALVRECIEGDGGDTIRANRQEVESYLKNAKALLKKHSPHVVCPTCKGECKIENPDKPEKKKKCPTCEGRGWLDQAQFKAFNSGTPPESAEEPALVGAGAE